MKLNDKIRGAITGYAFGDALGVGCEFMTRNEINSYYPDGLRHFDQIIRDVHRSQWPRGEWTNDTRHLTMLLECIIETGGFKLHRLARKLKDWYDNEEADLAPVYRMMLQNPEWLDNPIQVAHRIWHDSNYKEASNEALYRSLVTGLTSSEEDLMEHTRRITLMTHDDSKCVSTAKVMARMFYSLLHNGSEPSFEELEGICLDNDPRTLPYLHAARDGEIDTMAVDDEDTMTWSRKSMGVSLWSYWHSGSPAEIIYNVIDRGGDADTNAALAGALAGIRYGCSALPEEINKMPGLGYLLDLSDRLTEFVRQNRTAAKEC